MKMSSEWMFHKNSAVSHVAGRIFKLAVPLLIGVLLLSNAFMLSSSFLQTATQTDVNEKIHVDTPYVQYVRMFQRSPPPNFDDWVEFATDNKCSVDLKQYTQIYSDLDYWLKEGSIAVRDVDKLSAYGHPVEFKDGKFHFEKFRNAERIDETLVPLEELMVKTNKEFKFYINDFDEPRMVLGDNGFMEKYSGVEDVFRHSECMKQKFDSILEGGGWDGYDWIAGNKTLRSQHGFFLKPDTFGIVNARLPLFSQATLDCFGDITFPLDYHVETAAEPTTDPISWKNKKPVLFWRGSNTGGSYRVDAPWRQYPRSRIMEWERNWAKKNPDGIFDASKSEPPLKDKLNVDIGFSRLVQADDETKKTLMDAYGLKGTVSFEQTKNFKYLLVLDGNTWPGRFQSYLQTKSVILYNGIFTDWDNWMFRPWVHYVPIRLDYSDLEERLDWLMENDHVAEQISKNARRLMAHLNDIRQLRCYVGLLLLEYSNLYDSQGQSSTLSE